MTPNEWSKEYLMPILCMIDENEVKSAKMAFEAINKKNPDNSTIDKAINYLNGATFFAKLKDEKARNDAFVKSIIKDYDVMLNDIDEVKQYLFNKVSEEPYEWYGMPEVDKRLKQMAEAKYNQGGCEKALEKIDNMELADVKRYLKDLIRDDMTVGMAIIKDN